MARERYKIGQTYGGSRWRGPLRGGTDEWEWVHAGAEFAARHPMGQLRGWMLAVIAYFIAHAGLVVYAMSAYFSILWVMLVLDCLTLYLLLTKRMIAYPVVWGMLFLQLPLSLPLMFYWADGVRPNLIYRHRFERLTRSEPKETFDV